MKLIQPIKNRIGNSKNQIAGLESSFRKKIRQRINNPQGVSRPVFLVGCGRSGTSMIVFHLERSWQVDLYNENNPEAFNNFRLRSPEVVEALVEQSLAKVVLFKPILSTQQSKTLLSRFPESKVIFAFRHYHDVINSSINRFGPDNWLDRVNKWGINDFSEFGEDQPPNRTKESFRSLWRTGLTPAEGVALYWMFYNQLYFELNLKTHDRAMLVEYESMVRKPKIEFARICQFMEIEFDPAFVDGVFKSSIRKSAPADLSPDLQEECEDLWVSLRNQVHQH